MCFLFHVFKRNGRWLQCYSLWSRLGKSKKEKPNEPRSLLSLILSFGYITERIPVRYFSMYMCVFVLLEFFLFTLKNTWSRQKVLFLKVLWLLSFIYWIILERWCLFPFLRVKSELETILLLTLWATTQTINYISFILVYFFLFFFIILNFLFLTETNSIKLKGPSCRLV